MLIWPSAWYTKSDGDSAFNIQLPTELWAIIIDFIVVPLRHPHLYCEPENFLQYEAFLWNVDTSDKIPMLDDWKRIRAVCRKWKHLAGVNPWFFFKEEPGVDLTEPNVHQATSIVFIHSRANGRLAMERIAHLRENLTTLALWRSTIPNVDAVDTLLGDPSMFPNLRCLSVNSSRTKHPFWKVIQDRFPNLVSLFVRLDAYGAPGRYILKNIEILGIYTLAGFQLECPSLKHFHVSVAKSTAVHDFIMEHGHQLRSFVGVTPASIKAKKDAWHSTFPNLITYGCRIRTGLRSDPPPDHPLRHLRFFANHNSLTPEQVMSEIDAYPFPGLETVHIVMNDLRHGTVNELRARCQKRGIRLEAVVDGTPVVVQPPRLKMDYIKSAFRMCTLPCW